MTDTMDKDSIRAWYEANGMAYLPEDWGARAENGESASQQSAEPDRIGREWVRTYDPHQLARLESLEQDGPAVLPILAARTAVDHEEASALEEFFAQYFVRMPERYRVTLEETTLYDQRTQRDLADEAGIHQTTVLKRQRAALAWLVREVARDWPDPEGTTEQRFAAVLNEHWERTFG